MNYRHFNQYFIMKLSKWFSWKSWKRKS